MPRFIVDNPGKPKCCEERSAQLLSLQDIGITEIIRRLKGDHSDEQTRAEKIVLAVEKKKFYDFFRESS